MLRSARRIFEVVERKNSLGSSNHFKRENKNGVEERIDFIQNVLVSLPKIFLSANYQYAMASIEKALISDKTCKLLNYILIALFAEGYECGNCGELAALSFVELLKSNAQYSLEVVEIAAGRSLFSMDHFFVLYGREASSDLSRPETYPGTIVLDAWDKQLYEITPWMPVKKLFADVIGAKEEKITITSRIRIDDRSTYSNVFSEIKLFLISLKRFISSPEGEDFLIEHAKTNNMPINVQQDVSRLLAIINRDIIIYTARIYETFVIKHWQNPSLHAQSMFSTTDFRSKLDNTFTTNKKSLTL